MPRSARPRPLRPDPAFAFFAVLVAGAALGGCGAGEEPAAGATERDLTLSTAAGTVRGEYLGGCVIREGAAVCPGIALRPARGAALAVRPGEAIAVRGRPRPEALDARLAGETTARASARREDDRWLILVEGLDRERDVIVSARYADGDGTFVAKLRPAERATGGSGCENDPAQSLEQRLAAAVRTRRQFGFAADPDTMRTLATDPPPGVSCADLGVPLTPAEQRDLRERQQVAEGIPEIRRYARREAPDTFAGVWIDQRAGGIVHAAFTSEVAEHRRALRERFPRPDRLRVERAEFSERALSRVKDRISADLDALGRRGLDVRTVGVDVSANRVTVGMANPSQEAERRLRERYGPAVRVEPGKVVPVLRTAPATR